MGGRRKRGTRGRRSSLRLEDRLLLLGWMNHLLGYESNRELLEDCKRLSEGVNSDGHTYIYHHMLARQGRLRLELEDLARYDENILRHLAAINRRRKEPITLRYFQYLAALYAEIFLDGYFNRRKTLLKDLNDFVREVNARRVRGEPQESEFTEADLTKLAYWMATGSGKTLIMHLNYHQFRHYNKEPPDNILLITPNEGLSAQHLREFELSGIPARRFELEGGQRYRVPYEVQVLEITKLVERKRGGGVSVPLEAFEGRNLVFVDEGHKGAGGEAWRSYREALSKQGFTFEYSATFGQALSAAGNDALTQEYGKAILFDYSYRYFYADGFGKDFYILNLRNEERREDTETLLLGNLLSFYEQLRYYERHRDQLRPYNLEKPLWVFVGSRVNAVYSRRGRKRSDVLTVARFLHRVLSERAWGVETIARLLAGKSGLRAPDGRDLFAGHFPYLREGGMDAEALYEAILKSLFHAPSGGMLYLSPIRSSRGEIGLRASGAEDYFGLIYIGDTSAFRKLAEREAPEITWEEEAVRGSLFDAINRPDSRLHVLIGAKKFMEGWNSWRVSNMGLLNIGRQEGSQIIQLFGRGVRLKGKGMSMKRSSVLPGPHPKHIELLETLNVFAVRADYMARFREYLEREGVATDGIELPLFVEIQKSALEKGLLIPRTPEGRDFIAEERLLLEYDGAIEVRVDMSIRAQRLSSQARGVQTVSLRSGRARVIPAKSLALVDWEQVYLDLCAYKAERGWHNLIIRPEDPRRLIGQMDYQLIADDPVVEPRSFRERALLQRAVTTLLRKYMDRFYRQRRERWETEIMVYRRLDEDDPNLAFNRERVAEARPAYILRVKRDEQIVESLQKLIEDGERLYRENDEEPGALLRRISFERSLYQPLLLKDVGHFLSIVPRVLEKSEERFIRDLQYFWRWWRHSKTREGKEIYVLRNLSRGKGVGFFENVGFYPDFILWVLEGQRQRIIFVEPHGMLHAKAYAHDEKARLHEKLRALGPEIARRSQVPFEVSLDAFIISATPCRELAPHYDDGTWDEEKFAEKHILFFDDSGNIDYRYIEKMIIAPP